jgi:hypothetical protein
MLTPERRLRVEVKQGDSWVPCPFGDLEPGDVARAFNPDGKAAWRGLEVTVTASPSISMVYRFGNVADDPATAAREDDVQEGSAA